MNDGKAMKGAMGQKNECQSRFETPVLRELTAVK
jgi:hypothetical protein